MTWEHFDGKEVTITDSFKNFDSIQECVDELVKLWYKDYKSYKGVNRASTAGECAQLLKLRVCDGSELSGEVDWDYAGSDVGLKSPLVIGGRVVGGD